MTAEELRRRADEEIKYREESALAPKKKILDKEDFIHRHDEAFIDNAYRLILHRPPDPEGRAYYLGHLRSGRRSKMQIVANMAASEEAKKTGVRIRRIGIYRALSFLYKIPGLSYLVRWMVVLVSLPRLVQRHNALESALYAHTERIRREQEARWHAEMDEARKEEAARIEEWVERFEQRQREEAARRDHAWRALEGELRRRLEEAEAAWGRIESQRTLYERVARRLEEHLLTESEMRKEGKASLIAEELSADFYRALEARFRGTEEEIARRLRRYLPAVREMEAPSPALDIGCGRGEWLRLLSKEGVEAKGIDLNPLFVEKLRDEGLEVYRSEALMHLRSLPDDSLGLLTGFHIAEHLEFPVLMALLREARRVLRPGGMLLLETPNPRNLGVGACDFYTDPTHRRPLPPHLLRFLLEYAGFREVRIEPAQDFEPMIVEDPVLQSFVDDWVAQSPDYAVLGRVG